MDRLLKNIFQEDRRLHCERRKFRYSDHIPERRSGKERRSSSGFDSLHRDGRLIKIEALQAGNTPVIQGIAHRRL